MGATDKFLTFHAKANFSVTGNHELDQKVEANALMALHGHFSGLSGSNAKCTIVMQYKIGSTWHNFEKFFPDLSLASNAGKLFARPFWVPEVDDLGLTALRAKLTLGGSSTPVVQGLALYMTEYYGTVWRGLNQQIATS